MKAGFLIALLIVVATLQVQDSFACSCSSYPDFLMAWMESDGSFQGTVKGIQTDEGPRKVIFDIHHVQKGDYPYGSYTLGDLGIIHHGKDMVRVSSCGVDYKIGETYQVFVYDGNSMGGDTNMCSTKQISGFDEYSHEDEYGQMQHFRQDYHFFAQYNTLSLVVPAAVIAITVGIVVWRKRK